MEVLCGNQWSMSRTITGEKKGVIRSCKGNIETQALQHPFRKKVPNPNEPAWGSERTKNICHKGTKTRPPHLRQSRWRAGTKDIFIILSGRMEKVLS